MPNQIQGFQLSPQQRRVWILQQINSVYRAQCTILLEGNLNVGALKSALQQVIERHEILRTTFHRIRGIKLPIQVINSDRYPDLWQQASQKPLDWEQAPLLQLSLAKLSSSQYELLINFPALYSDAIGLQIFLCELSRCYTACLQGEELDDQPLQYAELSDWQNELLESEDTAAGRDYWQHLDISSLKALRLPFGSQSVNLEFAPQVFTLPIPQELIVKIEAIAHEYETSASVLFLTCWQILLWRLTEQSDLVIGVASDGRNYEELQASLGLLVKYLPVLGHLEDADKFSELLVRVEESVRNAYAKQQYFTWEQISEPNEDGTAPLFLPFCFEFESRFGEYFAGNVSFSLYKQYTCIERFQLKLCCVQQASLTTEFHYDANIFTIEDIQRLAGQFETLLGSVVANPVGAIAQFDFLSPIERQQLLVEFNHTKTSPLPYQCIHHWFEFQADSTPDNIAVVCGNQQLTYRELNKKANQLAHYLQKLGVQPEVIVGICVERSLEMIVGVLGILKAGGAYLPLDPAYPQERLAFILAESRVPVLLSQQKLEKILPKYTELLCLDNWGGIAQESTENPVSQVNFDNLAYAIYTSGSTGKPKGTLIPHQGLVNYLTWCTQAYAVEQGEGAVVHSSLAFDLTITGLFSPLLVGRRVELITDDFSTTSLSAVLRQSSNLSLVKITPAQLLLLSQQLSTSEAAGRTKAFIIGGENLLAESITFWQDYAPKTILVNEYGPTETVVGCCIYQVPQGEAQSGSVPIGRPIANTQLYVLNSYLQPVPMGLAGELYIGGAGLARGYLNHPELTAINFIPHPFSDEAGARLYKTGDLVRFRPDGNLEFLGRIDHQIKLRGFRIELEEIEGLLGKHPSVREAVVIAREDVPGQRLVAYVVPATNVITANNLRHFLKQQLPEYMLPSAFVILDALPLTTNGKVDRRALPAPDSHRPDLEAVYQAPQTELEGTIATVWQDALHLEKVGVHDNFFDLGGHSLLMVQVHRRLLTSLHQDISLIEMFEYPTINSLAKYLNQTQQEPAFQQLDDRVQKQKSAQRQKKLMNKSNKNDD